MSKVIFKLTFKHPNFKNTKSKNVAHIDYIATRSGVDKSLTANDLQRELSKGIEKTGSENDVYVNYINERPQSHGLFDQNGVANPETVKGELSEHDSFVWRAIVSLKEEDAKELGYLKKEKWQDLLRNKVPDMAKEMGIRINNINWVGAVHMAKGHPHVHIVFWEKEPERTIGVVSKKALENIKKEYTDEIFKEEKFRLMNEKTVMRDLIRDFAKGDMGQATRFLIETRETGLDIRALIQEENIADINPIMPRKIELELAEKIKRLSEILPGRGRANLKFMPEDVKVEVREIANFLLSTEQYSPYLESYLKIVEENNRLYTGKEEDLINSKENAYIDIRDRVCQIILKAAVESQKENVFYIDQELANNSVEIIKGISNQIDLYPEREKVFNKISVALIKTGHSDEAIKNILYEYSVIENLNYPKDAIDKFVNDVWNNGSAFQELNSLSSSKMVESYLTSLKLAGYAEKEAINLIRGVISNDNRELGNLLDSLKKQGFLKMVGGNYKLTNIGVEEFLKAKSLDKTQREIMVSLEQGKGSFDTLINNKNVFGNMYDKDPEEFKIGRFDLKVKDEFGEDNKITLKELENNLYEKYTSADITDVDKAEQEYDVLKNRVEKLCLNGYVKFDKETNVYSFTPEGVAALDNIPYGMEFSRYDANVTLTYIDKAENGVLQKADLESTLYKEIANKTANSYYGKFTDIIEQCKGNEYVQIDDDGNITATKEGQNLSKELNRLNKFFKESKKGNLSEEKIKEVCNDLYGENANSEFKTIMQHIEKQVAKGNVICKVDGTYSIEHSKNDNKNLLYQIYKAGGTIKKDNLKQTLEENIPNREAENQYKYLIKRLEFLKDEGFVSGKKGEYSITDAGKEKRLDLLHPERDLLRKEIKYLTRLGFIENTADGLIASRKYFKYMKDIATAKKKGIERNSYFINKDIISLIDKTSDNINAGKIKRTNQRILTGKYINNEYEEIKTSYSGLRTSCNVSDLTAKTLSNITKTLLAAGVDIENSKSIVEQWNIKSGSNLDTEYLNEIIDKAYKQYDENNTWGKPTVVSYKEWNEMFKSLGVQEVPKWMYKGLNWKSLLTRGVGMASIINDIWKSVWREFERERMQSEAQAELFKKNQIKQQAASQSKAAQKEAAIKHQDRSSLAKEEEKEL